MTFKSIVLAVAIRVCLEGGRANAATYEPSSVAPPPPQREFRAAWVATVANIDWPSERGLSVSQQKAELIALLDRAAHLRLNAIIFQVRPACDALYPSPLEPWSEYLTGTMGKAPQPFYDPLAYTVNEAHKRGLELHAWFNPYRALHFSSKSPVSPNHISKTKPQLVKKYGKYLWLDPGEKEVQEHSLSVVMDVVKRYDIDGVHFDDYFYPYKEKDSRGEELDFPDDASWQRFGRNSQLSRDDWRRENVNQFIRRVYQSIKLTKPSVKFGISPFGIWRPGNPPQIQGHDAYAKLYADSKKWLSSGWVDYFAPQLYWPIEQREQSFPVLLNWWVEQNTKQKHLWPGLSTSSAGKWKAGEISRQIQTVRKQSGSTGHIHWSMKSLLNNRALADDLAQNVYTEPALMPPTPWLDSVPSAKPTLHAKLERTSKTRIDWEPAKGEKSWLWLLQYRRVNKWTSEVLSADKRTRLLEGPPPDAIALTAVDRLGNASQPVTLARRK
jgi:uncharacterized lipoprotein YddW (UPF0748 family)